LEFEQACAIDYRLRPGTIAERMRYVRRLLKFLDKHPLQSTRQELRQFLTLNPTDGAVKALRVLYRRFLGSELASCFKVPQSSPHVLIVPSREQLLGFYENLETLELKVAFLMFVSSGLRRHELVELVWEKIDLENRIIYPNQDGSRTKLQWVTCFNLEAQAVLRELNVAKSPSPNERIFELHEDSLTRSFRLASFSDFKITPQILRDWFCCEMGRLSVPDRYIDAFCGRVPKSVLARNYTDYSPERLKEIYDKAGLEIFSAFSSSDGTALSEPHIA
jgi:integrase